MDALTTDLLAFDLGSFTVIGETLNFDDGVVFFRSETGGFFVDANGSRTDLNSQPDAVNVASVLENVVRA